MFRPDCNICNGYAPGNPGAYSGKWCRCTKEDRILSLIRSLLEELEILRPQVDYTNSSSGWAVAHLEDEIEELRKELKKIEELRPYGRSSFSSVEDEVSWINAMEREYGRYPDQGILLYMSCLYRRRAQLQGEGV